MEGFAPRSCNLSIIFRKKSLNHLGGENPKIKYDMKLHESNVSFHSLDF